jgi:hypothetical protein
MKKQTKLQKFNDLANAVHQINAGEKVKRIDRKDGSIATKPVVPCPDLPEKVVVKECISWLRKHHIFCNRHDVGGMNIPGTEHGYATYGIVGAGDIIGLLPTGQHFEVETKAGSGGSLNKNQRKRMRDIRNNRGLYFVVHGVPELEFYMERYVR